MTSEPAEYRISVRKVDGHYALMIEELGLIVEGETLEAAYESLVTRKTELISKAASLGFDDRLLGPQGTFSQHAAARANQRRIWNIALAIVATFAIATLILGAGATFALKRIQVAVSHMAEQQKAVINYAATDGARKLKENLFETERGSALVGNLLHRWATSPDMPADKKQELLQDIRTVVGRYKPILDEFRPLTSDAIGRGKGVEAK